MQTIDEEYHSGKIISCTILLKLTRDLTKKGYNAEAEFKEGLCY